MNQFARAMMEFFLEIQDGQNNEHNTPEGQETRYFSTIQKSGEVKPGQVFY